MHPLLHTALLGGGSSSPVLPAGITAREPPPSSRPPWLPSPSCQAQRGARRACVGLWGQAGFPLSFLLWPRKAGRTWASAFPYQRQAGEFLPHSLFLTCACASGSGACLYFAFCGLFGSGQSEQFKKNQTARWTKASGRGVLQAQAHVRESCHIERQIRLTAQVNLGCRMQVPTQVSNPEAVGPIPMHASTWDARKEQQAGGGFFSHSLCLFTFA